MLWVGFLLGTRQTILETKDGGDTWVPRSIPSAEDEDFNYRFNSISFKGKEGWIVGKPAILLHTSDSGNSWERIPLSSQLPGDMVKLSLTHIFTIILHIRINFRYISTRLISISLQTYFYAMEMDISKVWFEYEV